ncbi:hypothetical protein F5878DRAFT_500593, partial [Lentinula raphanica]
SYKLTLRNALHVPDAPFNLISVGCMTQAGFTVKFSGNSLSVFAPNKSSQEVMHGQRVRNLYVIEVTHNLSRLSTSTPSDHNSVNETLAFPSIPHAHSWKDWH